MSRAAENADALVIFGASGHLALTMLLPSLYNLDADALLEGSFPIVGVARTRMSTDEFRDGVRGEICKRVDHLDDKAWARFAARLDYLPLDATSAEGLKPLAAKLHNANVHTPIYYLATSPTVYPAIAAALTTAGLAAPPARIALEKPIGKSLETSRVINDAVAEGFSEDRVFRTDHYLGKETVQNLIALRFANALFEPLWNSVTVDHVQITVAETEGVGDRWPYYDEYGALRDMLQNHMMQLLCLVAMEPPSDLDPDSVRNEKIKVLRSLRPIEGAAARDNLVRGQYLAGVMEGARVPSYAEERGQETDTETFVAARVEIDNWRWAGTPFYLRTGKRLYERRTQIVIQFRDVPHSIFDTRADNDIAPNRLVIDLQPDEDISLLLMNKTPGLDGVRLRPVELSLSAANGGKNDKARRRIAYERLFLDLIKDNKTLFVRRDEVERAWEWVDDIAQVWRELGQPPRGYAPGSWGPPGAAGLIERSGRAWHG
jgi:glucose-6-phosphate 1-dehydrogenase